MALEDPVLESSKECSTTVLWYTPPKQTEKTPTSSAASKLFQKFLTDASATEKNYRREIEEIFCLLNKLYKVMSFVFFFFFNLRDLLCCSESSIFMIMACQEQLVCAGDLGTLKMNWLEMLFLCQSEFVLEFTFFS